ncbi:unnamed protein product, partial [Iphiclides podalirius]
MEPYRPAAAARTGWPSRAPRNCTHVRFAIDCAARAASAATRLGGWRRGARGGVCAGGSDARAPTPPVLSSLQTAADRTRGDSAALTHTYNQTHPGARGRDILCETSAIPERTQWWQAGNRYTPPLRYVTTTLAALAPLLPSLATCDTRSPVPLKVWCITHYRLFTHVNYASDVIAALKRCGAAVRIADLSFASLL